MVNESKKQKLLTVLSVESDSVYLKKCAEAEAERDNRIADLLVQYAQGIGPFQEGQREHYS